MKITQIFVLILALFFITGFAVADLYSPVQGDEKGLYNYDEPAALVVASIEKVGGTSLRTDIGGGSSNIGAGSGDIKRLLKMDIQIKMPYPFNQNRTTSPTQND